FEDVAAEIVERQPDPARWTTDEKFVVADRFLLGEKDEETMRLASAVAAHDTAFDALTKDGTPSLIALEKTTPAYSDILKRGDYFARLERVEPSVPHFLPGLPANAPRNRRGLADWLLAPEQPLMARVTAAADGPRHREPCLAGAVRPGIGRNFGGFRGDGRPAHASRIT
ncbi:MAG: hypothetical protein RLZZ221_1113, partial [Verrucomicrobiota bacterium]